MFIQWGKKIYRWRRRGWKREREMEKEKIKGRENEKMKHENIILNKLACMQL